MQHPTGETRDLPDDRSGEPFAAVIVDTRGNGEAERIALAAPVLGRWRRGGLAVALVCSRQGLSALPDTSRFEVVADDARAGTLTVDGTMRLLGEANRRVDAAPEQSLLVGHEPESLRAAAALGYRRIVAVAPGGNAEDLLEAGATLVITELRGLRFPRALPSALEHLDDIAQWWADRPLAVFLDYDGTLTPIVPHPADAFLAPEMRRMIAALAERFTVAVISGRDRPDVAERVGLGTLYYAGSHGLDIAGPGLSHTAPGAEAAARRLKGAAEEIRQQVGELPGVVIEVKRFSVAVHYRQAPEHAARVIDAAVRAAHAWNLELRPGKKVRELVPKLDWDKGRAVEWLCETLGIDPIRTRIVYIGDDETDEDAFRVLGEGGIGLRPGPRIAASLADYRLGDVGEVGRFLGWLASRS